MQRDMDLVRKLLIEVEKSEGPMVKCAIDGYSDVQIGYHAYIMAQAGFIEAVDATTTDRLVPYYIPTILTWDGHEFLNGIKSPTDWDRVKKSVIQPAGGFVVSLAKEYILHELKTRIGIA